MVTLALALAQLRPDAVPGRDYLVRDDGRGPYLAGWDEAKLGPRPTAEEIARASQLAATRAESARQERADRRARISTLSKKTRTTWTTTDTFEVCQMMLERLAQED